MHKLDACVRCKNTVVKWHCDNNFCPWCHACGQNAKDKGQKNNAK